MITRRSLFAVWKLLHAKHRPARHEWRLIPIGLRGKVLRVLVVYLRYGTRKNA